MEWHTAMVTGAKGNSFATENFGEVVRVDGGEGEGEAAMEELKIEN